MIRVRLLAASTLRGTRLCHPLCTPLHTPSAPPRLTLLLRTNALFLPPIGQDSKQHQQVWKFLSFLQRLQCNAKLVKQVWQLLQQLLLQLMPEANW